MTRKGGAPRNDMGKGEAPRNDGEGEVPRSGGEMGGVPRGDDDGRGLGEGYGGLRRALPALILHLENLCRLSAINL